MSAIDHKAESVRLAQLADLSYGAIEHRNGASAASEGIEALMLAAEALVHATLYAAEQTAELVKQQRIANLLSIASFSHDAEAGQRLFTDMEGASKWRDEAARALGLS